MEELMEIEVNDNRIRLHDFLMFQAQCNIKLKEKNEEIERLNNIINELEKYIIDFKEDYEKNEFQPNAKVYIYWKDLIDKLQELKGEDKE